MPKVNLTSGEEMNRQYPDTFHIPTREERESLKPGQSAKLIFEDLHERMWVSVVEKTDTGYLGSLDNIPTCPTSDIDYGDLVEFGPEHVIDIFTV